MCDHALVRPTSSKDDTIGSRTASGINILVTQDGKFVVGTIIWKGEAFVVVILVRVFIVAHSGPILVIAVALLHGSVDIILGIACAATGFCALALGDVRSRELYEGRQTNTKKRVGEDGDGEGQCNECLSFVNSCKKQGSSHA